MVKLPSFIRTCSQTWLISAGLPLFLSVANATDIPVPLGTDVGRRKTLQDVLCQLRLRECKHLTKQPDQQLGNKRPPLEMSKCFVWIQNIDWAISFSYSAFPFGVLLCAECRLDHSPFSPKEKRGRELVLPFCRPTWGFNYGFAP